MLRQLKRRAPETAIYTYAALTDIYIYILIIYVSGFGIYRLKRAASIMFFSLFLLFLFSSYSYVLFTTTLCNSIIYRGKGEAWISGCNLFCVVLIALYALLTWIVNPRPPDPTRQYFERLQNGWLKLCKFTYTNRRRPKSHWQYSYTLLLAKYDILTSIALNTKIRKVYVSFYKLTR